MKHILALILSLASLAVQADTPWTRNLSAPFAPRQGLAGRHICVWASHGRYYKQTYTLTANRDTLYTGKWVWQRPNIFCTNEDLLTPSFVYPFLIPMLENAGAVVWTPRERDPQPLLAVADTLTSETDRHYVWQLTAPTAGRYAVYVTYPRAADAVPDATYTIHHGGERTRIAVNQRIGADTWVYLGTFGFNPAIPRDGRITLSKDTRHRGRPHPGTVRIGGGTGHIARHPGHTLPTDSIHPGAVTSQLPHYLEAARYWTQWAGLPDSLYDTENGLGDYNDDLRARSNMLNRLRTLQGVPLELSLAIHTDAGYRTDSIPYASLAIHTSPGSIPRRTEKGDSILYYDGGAPGGEHLCRQLLDGLTRDLAPYNWQHRGIRDANYSETRAPGVTSAILEMLSHQNFLDARLAHDPLFKFRISRSIYKSLVRNFAAASGREAVIQPLPVHAFSALVQGREVRLAWHATPDTLEPTARPTHYIIYTRIDDGDFDNGLLTTDTLITLPLTAGHRHTYRIVAANDGGLSFPSPQLTAYRPKEKPHPASLRLRHLSPVGERVRLRGGKGPLCEREGNIHKTTDSLRGTLSEAPLRGDGGSPLRGVGGSPLRGRRGFFLLTDAFTRLSGPAFVSTPDSVGFLLTLDPGVPYGTTLEYCGAQQCFTPAAIGKEGPGGLGHSGSEREGTPLTGNTFDICARRAALLVQTDSLAVISSITADALPTLTPDELSTLTPDELSTPSSASAAQDTAESPDAGHFTLHWLAGQQRRVAHNMADYPVWPAAVRPFIERHLRQGHALHVEGTYTAPALLSPEERQWWDTLPQRNITLPQ